MDVNDQNATENDQNAAENQMLVEQQIDPAKTDNLSDQFSEITNTGFFINTFVIYI